MNFDKDALFEQFRLWHRDGESERTVDFILSLPQSALDDDILSYLARAYIDTGEYKQAIAVLDGLAARLDGDYNQHYCMALALYSCANTDDECEEDEVLRRNILERAQIEIARCMNLNPPEGLMDTADELLERIDDEISMIDGDDDLEDDCEMYDDDEIDAVEAHIEEYFGDFPTVFHELHSPDIHCDIYIVPPTGTRDYYTLLTVGMGAHVMDIPENLDPDEHGRAELLICLPKYWKIGENDSEWFWPIALLKNLARLPLNTESWLGWGHSVDHRAALYDGTKLCGSLLVYPEDCDVGANVCLLPSGESVNFFEIIPIYREEMNFKIDNDTRALLEKMKGVSHVADPHRKNVCEDYYSAGDADIIDRSENHSRKIAEKNLPLDMINGANHIAIFLRRCIERGLAAPEFYKNCAEAVEGVLSGKKTDIREYFVEHFGGDLEYFQFSYLGATFCKYYYNWDDADRERFYPADVDAYAEKYFGTEKYNSEDFQDEAYLFVPFDEEYYKGMCGYIDSAFEEFYPKFMAGARADAKDELDILEELTGFSGVFIENPREAAKQFARLREEWAKDGFVPTAVCCGEYEEITCAEDVKLELAGTLDEFCKLCHFLKVPAKDEKEAAEKLLALFDKRYGKFDNAEFSEELAEARKYFGTAPVIIERSADGKEFFILAPREDGTYFASRKETDE